MIHRSPLARARVLLAATAAAALLVAGCTGSDEPAEPEGPDGPPDQVTYLTGFGLFGREAFAHVADAKGFFAEQNLEVTIESGAGSANHDQLVSGAAQFTTVDSAGAFQRWADGDHQVQVVSAIQQLPLTAIITLEGYGIERPSDLEGKTIGGAAGAVTEALFPTYADLAGFNADAVNWEPLPPPELPAALAAKQVDAIALFLVGSPAVETASGGKEAVVLPYSDYFTDLYGTVTVAPTSLIEEDPDLVRRFNTALMQGLDYAIEHPDEAGEILNEAVPEQQPEVAAAELLILAPFVRAGLNDDDPTGTMNEERLGRNLATLEAAGYIVDSGLTVDQGIMAWDLVPGADGGGEDS